MQGCRYSCQPLILKRGIYVLMQELSNLYNRRKRKQKSNDNLTFVDPQSIKFEAVVKYVDASIPLQPSASVGTQNEEPIPESEKSVLVGLHTCGNLSCTLLDLFCANECISALVFVGCCYNMLTLPNPMTEQNKQTNIENNTDNKNNNNNNNSYTFPMSQYARTNSPFQMNKVLAMLGCQAVSRWADTQEHLQDSISTLSKNHYRAMFQIFLRDTYGINKTLSIGHMSDDATSNFPTYAKSALKVLEKKILQVVDSCLPNEAAVDKAIATTFSKYNLNEKLMKVWWCVRGVMATVIENMILVDRIMYLHEKGHPNSSLLSLFNPILSPRNHCIVVIK